jgi:hypothetical protein
MAGFHSGTVSREELARPSREVCLMNSVIVPLPLLVASEICLGGIKDGTPPAPLGHRRCLNRFQFE